MIPFATDTVTLIHKEGSEWRAYTIQNCSYRRTHNRAVVDKTETITEETVCRIPAGNVKPAPGDVIALGWHAEAPTTAVELVRLLDSLRPGGAFRVQSVSDNVRPGVPVPHYAARGV